MNPHAPDRHPSRRSGWRSPVFYRGGRWCPRSAAVHISGNGLPASFHGRSAGETGCSAAGSGTGSPEPGSPRKENRPFPEEPAARETKLSSYAGITQIRSTGHGAYADSQPASCELPLPCSFLQFIYDNFQYSRASLSCQPLHFTSRCAMMGTVRHTHGQNNGQEEYYDFKRKRCDSFFGTARHRPADVGTVSGLSFPAGHPGRKNLCFIWCRTISI